MAAASVQLPFEDVVAGMDQGSQCAADPGRVYLPVGCPLSCAAEASNPAACGAEALNGTSSGSQAQTSAFPAVPSSAALANEPARCARGSRSSPTASPASTRAPSPEPTQKLNLPAHPSWADLEHLPLQGGHEHSPRWHLRHSCWADFEDTPLHEGPETSPRWQLTHDASYSKDSGTGGVSSGFEARSKSRWADIMELESDEGDAWEPSAAGAALTKGRANTDELPRDRRGKKRSDRRRKAGRSHAATDSWCSDPRHQGGHHKSWRAAGTSWSSWGTAGTARGDAWSADSEYGNWGSVWKTDAWANMEDWSKRGRKLQCQFQVAIEEEATFRVVRRLLGPAGQHMKDIAMATGAKLRLRGRGSKFLEGPEQVESADPLMLCVSVEGQGAYTETVDRVTKLLDSIYADYTDFCLQEGKEAPELRVDMHEGPREGSR